MSSSLSGDVTQFASIRVSLSAVQTEADDHQHQHRQENSELKMEIRAPRFSQTKLLEGQHGRSGRKRWNVFDPCLSTYAKY